jgi:hypothetical protein
VKTDQWALLILTVQLAMPDMPAWLRRVMALGYAAIYFAVAVGWIQ